MTTVNLACREGHTFEVWFRSKAEFSRQHAAKLIACPWCGERHIERRPNLPNVLRSNDKASRSSRSDAARDAAREAEWVPSPSMQSFAHALHAFHRYIERTCDDVGDRFASEARKMHEEHEERREQGKHQQEQAEGKTEMFPRSKCAEGQGERGIYGQATTEELRALDEEGISVSPLPPLPSRYN